MKAIMPPWRWLRRPKRTASNHRVYAIGDLHGRFDLFRELVGQLEADNARRADRKVVTLVILGDFIDRGPSSQRLLQMLMTVQRHSQRLTVLLGNHEAMLLDCVAGNPFAQRAWLKRGGLETLADFGVEPPLDHEDSVMFGERVASALTAPVIEWLAGLPVSIECGDYFFCHAGVRPGRSLKRQRRNDLLWIREPFISTRRNLGAVVVHGHTVVKQVKVEHNRIGIDTGAWSTGVLSAICLDGDAIDVLATAPDTQAVVDEARC